MQITDLSTFARNYRTVNLDPSRKKLKLFVKERINQIKKEMSNELSQPRMQKMIREQDFMNAIIEVDEIFDKFFDLIDNKLQKNIECFSTYVLKGAQLQSENKFLKERLETMDKRELDYIEILKSK